MITYPLMADSVQPAAIPASAFAAAALYLNGRYAATEAEVHRFRHVIRISVLADRPDQAEHARALDVETGDATPADVPGWIDTRRRFGHDDATIYCDRDNIRAVAEAAAGRPFRLWVATLDGTKFGPESGYWAVQYQAARPGAVARRYRLYATSAGYDVSVVYGTPDFTRVR